jgi:hypothetical protein
MAPTIVQPVNYKEMEIKYLIEHKGSRLYVKEIEAESCLLTTDYTNCLSYATEEQAEKNLDLIYNKEEFEVVEHGFY